MTDLTIVGGGLAGCEAAWQAAERGVDVCLYEMRPGKMTPAHQTPWLAEIICSNSFGSTIFNKSSGLLIAELELLNSLLLRCARECRVPAGHALAVDRTAFSQSVQNRLEHHPRIKIMREEVMRIPAGACILASGPLTSPALSESIQAFTGHDNLFFYDAMAPIVEFDSIDMGIAFWGSRYRKGSKAEGDYINCPFNDHRQYDTFVNELMIANRIPLKDFESPIDEGVKTGKGRFFEACLPIEVMAARGHNTLTFGPLRPVGLRNPHTGERPYAVVQLRQDDLAAQYFNIVGFQTNLTYPEQERVFRLIPGLEKARFTRFGQMHRNTFVYSPEILHPTLQSQNTPGLLMAGQIIGVEGYLANIATGLLAGMNAARWMNGKALLRLPETSMLGALCHYISNPNPENFQPKKANFALLPPLDEKIKEKQDRYQAYTERALAELKGYLITNDEK